MSLAADKMANDGMGRSTVTKIFRLGTSLLGITGILGIGMELLGWFKSGAHAEDFPESARTGEDDLTSLIVVQRDGRVFMFERTPYPFQIEDAKCAFGSGATMAMVALDCGKTAAEAVALVSRHNVDCGCGIDVLNLFDVPEAIQPTLQ